MLIFDIFLVPDLSDALSEAESEHSETKSKPSEKADDLSDVSDEELAPSQLSLFEKIKSKIEEKSSQDLIETETSFMDLVNSKKSPHNDWNDKDFSDISDKGISENEQEDEIPSFDEDDKKPDEILSKKVKKKTKRLSDEQIKKALDSESSESEPESKPEKQPKVQEMPRKSVSAEKFDNLLKPSLKRLNSRELSEMVNQPSPDRKSEDRKLKMIDALPQPPRYAKLRGISASTITKMAGPKTPTPKVCTCQFYIVGECIVLLCTCDE